VKESAQLNQQHTEKNPPESVRDPHHTKSRGEKFFDRGVYGGLAGVGTFIATLGLAFQLKHGGWAGPRYNQAIAWTEKKLGAILSKNISRSVAEEAVMTTSLMMGGNAMIVPIGVAEHYKVPIVSGLNTAMGDKTPPETIEAAPKQTWWSLIEGRMVAWGAVFGALMAARFAVPKTFAQFPLEVGERSHQLVQWMRKQPLLAPDAMKKTKAFRYGEIGAFDVFATMAAATILYVGGHFFARKQAEKKADRAEQRHATRQPALAIIEDTPSEVRTQVVGEKRYEGVVHEATRVAEIS
jgi:hypothetical protein